MTASSSNPPPDEGEEAKAFAAAYFLRRHGAAPDLVPDLIATSLDAINELICKQAHLPVLAPRLPSAAIGGPCARGCPTTARNRDGGGGGGTRLYIATAIPV